MAANTAYEPICMPLTIKTKAGKERALTLLFFSGTDSFWIAVIVTLQSRETELLM